MNQAKRYHFLSIFYKLWISLKNSIFIIFILFVFNFGSTSFIFKYGRIVFIIAAIITIIVRILQWFTQTYTLTATAFQLRKGIFSKKEQTISYDKIENINRKRSLFHRTFHLTSMQLETGMTGDSSSVHFPVLTESEAAYMEQLVTDEKAREMEGTAECWEQGEEVEDDEQILEETVLERNEENELTVHFTPTKKDVIKASFTSLSFLILIPLLGSFYAKVSEVFELDEKAEGVLLHLLTSWWMIAIVVLLVIIVSALFGIVRAYLKYGKYEIASDDERIYITQGLVNESAFSIAKQNVQAVEVNQPLLKRIFGIAEVKLISVRGLEVEQKETEVNSLFPFLPIDQALHMVNEMLPSYEITRDMTRLPRKSLLIRMVKISWIWIIGTVLLFIFKPTIFGFVVPMWILSFLLLIVILLLRLLEFKNTRFTMNERFIQFKQGSIGTSLFVTNRMKIMEVKIKQNMIQQKLGLTSIEVVNRANPVHHTELSDVPINVANEFYHWYQGRRKEVTIE